jgi:hypothetical protein
MINLPYDDVIPISPSPPRFPLYPLRMHTIPILCATATQPVCVSRSILRDSCFVNMCMSNSLRGHSGTACLHYTTLPKSSHAPTSPTTMPTLAPACTSSYAPTSRLCPVYAAQIEPRRQLVSRPREAPPKGCQNFPDFGLKNLLFLGLSWAQKPKIGQGS